MPQGERLGKSAFSHSTLEKHSIQLNGARKNADAAIAYVDGFVERATKLVQRMSQGLSRLGLIALTPQKRCQFFSRDSPGRAPGEVSEKRKLLAPAGQQLS